MKWVWIQLIGYINTLIDRTFYLDNLPTIDELTELAWENIQRTLSPESRSSEMMIAKLGDCINFIARAGNVPQHTKTDLIDEIFTDILEDAPFLTRLDCINLLYGGGKSRLTVYYRVEIMIERSVSDNDVKLFFKKYCDFVGTYRLNFDVINIYDEDKGRHVGIMVEEPYNHRDLILVN